MWLSVDMWMMETEPGFPGNTVSAFNAESSLQPILTFKFIINILGMMQACHPSTLKDEAGGH